MTRVAGIVLGAMLALGAGPAAAAPDATVQMLMNTPTPLLSFGLVRLETLLEKRFGPQGTAADGVTGYSVNVTYDPSRNRIVMELLDFATLTGRGEESCPAVFAAVRSYAGLTEDGSYSNTFPTSRYAAQFMPVGIAAPELAAVGTAVDAILEIAVVPTFVLAIRCTGPLLGTDMRVQNDGLVFPTLPQ